MAANAYQGGMAAPQIQRMYDLADAFTARGMGPNVTVGGWGGLAQGIGGLAQALAGKTIADKADRKRGEYADRLKGQIGGLGLDPKYGPLVDILAENGDYGTIINLATQQQDQPEGFTLGEGQQRFDAAGNVIATGPAKREEPKEPKWLTGRGPGGITFEYQPETGKTNLARPGGGFYTMQELGGALSGQQPSAPAAGGQAPAAFEPTIQAAAKESGVPPDLLRELIRRESNFNPQAVSKAGALGIAQFMPATAGEMGIDPLDPQESIYGAAKYLKQQYDRFKDWGKALAAYNAGPGRVAAGGQLPKETQDYVAALAPAAGGGGDFNWDQFQTPKQAAETDPVKIANDLRDEFTKLTKDYRDSAVAYQKIDAAAKNPSAAGDISLIFGYMKMIDPGSTVREGEFATAEQAQGVPSYVINLYNKARTGERLPDEVRLDFANQAKSIFGIYNRQFEGMKSQYSALAERLGVSPEDVIISAPEGEGQAPNMTAEEIENRYLRGGGGLPAAPGMY